MSMHPIPIRVLQVVGDMRVGGGIQHILMNIYQNMDRSIIQYDFLVRRPKGTFDYEEEINKLGGTVYRLSSPKKHLVSYFISNYRFFKNHPEYTIIQNHICTSIAFFNVIPALLTGRRTIIMHSHNTDWDIKKQLKLFKPLIKLFHPLLRMIQNHLTDYFFSISKAAGVWSFGKKVVNSNKHYIIFNGQNLNQFSYNKKRRQDYRNKLHLNGQFVIGHIGRFAEQKNHQFLIHIFEQLVKIKPNAVLMLIGAGEEQVHIKQLVKDQNLSRNVLFLGIRKDIPSLLQVMDVFVMPSLYEGLGNAAIEAQASGLITIVSDVLPEEVKITNLLRPYPLQKSAKEWAIKIINSCQTYKRQQVSLPNSKYNVRSVATQLQHLYISMRVNNKKE